MVLVGVEAEKKRSKWIQSILRMKSLQDLLPCYRFACEDGGEGALRDDICMKHKIALGKEFSEIATRCPRHSLLTLCAHQHEVAEAVVQSLDCTF